MHQHDEEIHTLRDLLEKKAAKNGGKVAFLSGGRQVTYGELDSISGRIAASLRELGIAAGDKVALMLANSFEFLYCWFATVRLGAVLVPLNVSLKGDLLKYQVNDSDSKIVIIEKAFFEAYNAVMGSMKAVRHHIYLDREAQECTQNGFLSYGTLLSGEERNSSDMREEEVVRPSDPATIIYSSGSTGPPKGVVLPHFSYINTGLQNASIAEAREGDVFFSTVPFFHTSGQLQIVIPAMTHDLKAAFEPWFHASQWWNHVREYRATVIFLLGSMVNILLKQTERSDDTQHVVRLAMTGGANRHEWQQFERRFGIRVLEGFGMSETAAITLFNRFNDYRVGSVGKPLSYFEAKIVDEDDIEVPPKVKGELIIRPRIPFTMMLEYYRKPQETVEAWRNLWFHTGDFLYRDEDGYYFFVERKKDVIRRKGENISPFDIETIINQHPKILESVVVGVHGELDEEVKVYVRLRSGESLGPVDLLRWCEERLPYNMVPRYVEFMEEIPKTPTQKVQRYLLRQRGIGAAFDANRTGLKLKRPLDDV